MIIRTVLQMSLNDISKRISNIYFSPVFYTLKCTTPLTRKTNRKMNCNYIALVALKNSRYIDLTPRMPYCVSLSGLRAQDEDVKATEVLH